MRIPYLASSASASLAYAALAFAVLALVVTGCTSTPTATVDPIYRQAGRTPAELSTAWWQWAMAAPSRTSPIEDATGAYCGVGQQGDIWFLAGGSGAAHIARRCAVPAGKFLFFPIITTAYWPAEDEIRYTCEQAMRNAAANNDAARDLFVEVDGVAVRDPMRLRADSGTCFNILAKADPSSHPYQAYPSAADGYWVLLAPLQRGRHTVRFGGRYTAPGERGGGTVEDIEYQLSVE